MSYMKRAIETARDEGLEAFYNGEPRIAPEGNLAEFWLEGYDYGEDMQLMQRVQSEEEIERMLDFHFGTQL